MQSSEIRSSFLDFFVKRGHTLKKSSSLVSADPTVLLTTAGMQQFIPYFLGDKTTKVTRFTSSQKCFRTPDIDEVGDESHNTFFEMLGNFSVGDYFKEDAIKWAWEFFTVNLKISPEKLWVTIFSGEDQVERDIEAEKIWKKIGVSPDRIIALGKESNFWGPPGESGPCGPSSELHYDRGEEFSSIKKSHDCGPNCDCGRFLELWNLVFMQNFCAEDGILSDLPNKNIDTGAGLERIAMVLQGKKNIFETDLFKDLLSKIETITKKEYANNERVFRIIADHVRGAAFLLADGVIPGKNGRDYILRRVIRRAIRQAERLGYSQTILGELALVVINEYKEFYPELEENKNKIIEELNKEESQFRKTLARGLKIFEKETADGFLNGKTAFDLFQTYGFPIELVKELAAERKISFDKKGYTESLKKHQEISRIGARSKFERKGGGQGEEVKKAHTATHLLQQALRDVLGEHVTQAGSRLFDDELSFDFRHGEKMSNEEKKKVEEIVNSKIKAALPVKLNIMPLAEAKKFGALGLFEEKYGDKVQVCSVEENGKMYSKELCGGPHVSNTSDIKKFIITKEKSSSAGIRRIKAIVGDKALKNGQS